MGKVISLSQEPLGTKTLKMMAMQRPDLLLGLCRENFLPPTQLALALAELTPIKNKEAMIPFLQHLLHHESKTIRDLVKEVLTPED